MYEYVCLCIHPPPSSLSFFFCLLWAFSWLVLLSPSEPNRSAVLRKRNLWRELEADRKEIKI